MRHTSPPAPTTRSASTRPTGHTRHTRQEQKQQTRQSLLDAGLRLLDHQSLSSLGLREVTRAAGLTPTAFYRHFASLSELGVALVEEAFVPLRGLVRDLRNADAPEDATVVIDRTVDVTARHVAQNPAHFRFVTREWQGGVREVREAIADRLGDFADDLVDYLSGLPDTAGWSREDLRMLADLYVDHMVLTAARLLDAADPADRERITATARRQLQVINLGRRAWPR
ncbi:TetR family transcriptional regulator [Phaeacidiphilus oryzae]|uniref:TetR family transcriptional regulator n=1 Tax=Phaeacidiphilus oryzae TaxID=348818 RepID=UPI0005620469|nr:TetR family transcriptional regulator [Phaeacidiphilus oryzae]